MRCQDLMRRPVQFVHVHDAVQVAARVMRESNVGVVPVCDRERHVQGVITDRDITLRLVAENRNAETTEVAELMSLHVVTCLGSDEVERAEALMRRHQKSRVLVTDPAGALQGIIGLAELARYSSLEAANVLRVVAEREIPVGGSWHTHWSRPADERLPGLASGETR